MTFQVVGDGDTKIDAHFDIDGSAIVFHARGGSGKQSVNTQYADGLRIVLERLKEARIQITDAKVDSRAVQALPVEKRRILPPQANSLDAETLLGELANRMRAVREDGNEQAKGGNSTKRIRIETDASSREALAAALRCAQADSPPGKERQGDDDAVIGKAWAWLEQAGNIQLTTATGSHFSASVEQNSLRFVVGNKENTKSISHERFQQWTRRYLSGARKPTDYQNNTGESLAANASYFIPVIEHALKSVGQRSLRRLPAEELYKVQPHHIYNAVQRLLAGEANHPFAASTDYDVLLEDGTRLPPKAVFGLAATEALGFQVKPEHFSAGIGMPCFTIIEGADFRIVPKGASEPAAKTSKPAAPPVAPEEDREFAEGKPKRIEHLKRERHQGASKAKKAAFKSKHGILFCERCLMKPIEVYKSEVGEACIEVHHTKPIADMKEGDKTKLEDLMCLCASCHRVVHRELRLADK